MNAVADVSLELLQAECRYADAVHWCASRHATPEDYRRAFEAKLAMQREAARCAGHLEPPPKNNS